MNEFKNTIINYFKTTFPTHKEENISKLSIIVQYPIKIFGTHCYLFFRLFDKIPYKLYKTLTPTMNNVIKTPKKLDKSKYQELTLNEIDKQYEQTVLLFIETLKQRFSHDQLLFMYKNLKSIRIKTKQYLKTVSGYYDNSTNKIILDAKKGYRTIIHELFHMATTSKTINGTYSGFENNISFLIVGRALNEGYTEIMSKRYFNANIDYSAYHEQVIMCKKLESIIGKDTMEQLYISADLNGLINELCKYAPKEEILNFIYSADEILDLNNYLNESNLLDQTISKINDTIIEKKIQVDLFLHTLACRKENKSNPITNNLKELYTCNNIQYKNLYLKCLSLFQYMNSIESIKEVVEDDLVYSDSFYYIKKILDIIGYDQLEDICYKVGIKLLIEKLKNYLNDQEVYELINLINNDIETDEAQQTIRNHIISLELYYVRENSSNTK